jgi:hypothetical protein
MLPLWQKSARDSCPKVAWERPAGRWRLAIRLSRPASGTAECTPRCREDGYSHVGPRQHGPMMVQCAQRPDYGKIGNFTSRATLDASSSEGRRYKMREGLLSRVSAAIGVTPVLTSGFGLCVIEAQCPEIGAPAAIRSTYRNGSFGAPCPPKEIGSSRPIPAFDCVWTSDRTRNISWVPHKAQYDKSRSNISCRSRLPPLGGDAPGTRRTWPLGANLGGTRRYV